MEYTKSEHKWLMFIQVFRHKTVGVHSKTHQKERTDEFYINYSTKFTAINVKLLIVVNLYL